MQTKSDKLSLNDIRDLLNDKDAPKRLLDNEERLAIWLKKRTKELMIENDTIDPERASELSRYEFNNHPFFTDHECYSSSDVRRFLDLENIPK